MKKESFIYLYVLIACCLLACATIGVPNTYGLFYQPLSTILNTGKANATLHVSIAGLVTGFSSPLIVKALKKISYRPIFIGGIFLLLISGFLIAKADSLLIVNFAGVLRGLGFACSTNVIITMLTGNWFKSSRGAISGLIMSFSGIMGSLFSPVVSKLLENLGFQKAYLICIFIMVGLSIPAMFVPLKPENIGMKAYENDKKQKEKESYAGRFELKFLSPAFILLMITSLLVICVTTLTSYLPSYVESLSLSAASAASLLSASMVGNVLFKFLIGLSIDRYGVLPSFIVFMAICFIGLFVIIFSPHNMTILFLAGILYGACYAVNKVAIPLTVRILFGDKSYGEAYSMLSLTENIARSAVITAIGFMFDLTGTYRYNFLLALLACILSSLMIIYLDKKKA